MDKIRNLTSSDRPRLVDVARLAGVSTATASRALSNPEIVAPDTRKAVEDAARLCGYKINLLARSLRTQRSNTVLVLVPGIDNQFYPEIIEGLEAGARTSGYSIILGFTGKDRQRELAYVELLNNQRADGLVIVDDGVRQMFDDNTRFAVPTVQLLETHCGSSAASIRIEDETIGTQTTQHLLDLGHRRIAHVAGRSNSVAASRRIAGYLKALERAGLTYQPELLVAGDYTFNSGADAIDRLMDGGVPPTALFCANDAAALGALQRCRQRGIKVPGQMSIIGIDDIAASSQSDPPLTTVRVPRRDLGMAGVTTLIQIIERRKDIQMDVVLPHQLVVRASTAPPHHS